MLTGLAKDVYCALSTSECSDNGLFKERTLQAYALVLKRFIKNSGINPVKQSGQTHVECARESKNAFHRWLTSTKVDDYEKN